MEEISPLQAPGQPVSPKSKDKLVKIIAAAGILSFFSAGSLLASRLWDPLWSPFRPEPDAVISQMAGKAKEIKTLHLISDISFKIKENGKDTGSFSMNIEGDSDNSNPGEQKSNVNFNLVFSGEGMEVSLAFENRKIGEASYIKATTLPALPVLEPMLAVLGIDLSKVKNQWIKIDEEGVKDFFGDLQAQQIEKNEKQKEAEKQLNDLLADKKLYSVKKEFNDEKIGNEKTYHYLVSLNKDELKNLIPEALKIIQETGREDFSGAALPEIQNKLSGFLDGLGDLSADIWIGKKDNFLRKISGRLEIKRDLSSTVFQSAEELPAVSAISVDFSLEYSNFNQAIKIEAPSDSKTIKEVLTPSGGGIFSPFLNAQGKARDARRRADLRQIMIAMEMYYDDNSKYLQSKNMPTAIGE